MSKEKKLSLRLGLLAGISSMALLATTAGSLAWYAYSRTVALTFVGTSIVGTSSLNIGLVDNDNYFSTEDLTTYSLEREQATEGTETNSIVWSKSRNGFPILALRHYLEQSPHAVDKLHPVTTRSRAIDSTADLDLRRSPEPSETDFSHQAAFESYSVLPLAFRVLDENRQYVAGKNIWLTDTDVDASQDVDNSVRVFIDGASKMLIKPADKENHVGETKVGGLLAISNTQYYDRDGDNREYYYGEFESTPVYASTGYPDDVEHNVLVNVNGVEDTSQQTTFLAKHYPGSFVPDIATAVPKVQEYYGVGKVKPSVDSNGRFFVDTEHENGMPIAVTSNTSKIGYAKFTIFVEGWDHSIIDQNNGYAFDLALQFEIDRL